jgi:hypothetical protein
MKSRDSFISNSSSTSFVFVIPDDFTIDYSSCIGSKFTKEQIEKVVNFFITYNYVDNWTEIEEISSELAFQIIDTIFMNHMIVSFPTSPNWPGVRMALTPKMITEKLNENKK